MSSYSSAEFDPKTGTRPYSVGAAIFNGQLWMVGPSNAFGQMAQTYVPVDTLNIEKGDLTNPSNWHSSSLQILGLTVSTRGRCALAATSTGLCLVWNQIGNPGSLMSSFYSQQTGQAEWGQAITLLDQGGAVVHTQTTGVLDGVPIADVSVTTYGDSSLLISCPSAASGGQTCVYVASYRLSDIDQQKWQAAWSTYITPAQLSVTSPAQRTVKQTGLQISMEWFPVVPSGYTSQSQPEFYVAIFFKPELSDGSTLPRSFVLPAALSSDQSYLVPEPSPAALTLTNWIGGTDSHGFTVVRDPANRLQAYTMSATALYGYVVYNTYSNFTPSQAGYIGGDTLTIGVHDGLVSSVFYVTPATGTPVSSLVYEILVYSSEVRCQVNFFGTAKMVSSTEVNPVGPSSQVKNVVLGIVDGPVPFPNENSQAATFQDTNYECGVLTLSSSSSTVAAVQSTGSVSFGLKSEEDCTDGVGVAWDASLSSGWTKVAGNTTSELLTTFNEAQSPLSMQPTQTIEPQGTLYCSTAVLTVTTFSFTDAHGNVVCDSSKPGQYQAPQFFSVQCGFGDPQNWGFTPYSVMPGDVRNYTPEAWNARMKQLGYAGENYFAEMIVPNACVFAGGQPYLTAAWSPSATSSQGYTKTQSSFVSHSWNLDDSVYAGVSGAGGVDVFGMGEEVEFKIMAGISTSYTSDTSETQQSDWGIALSETWGPPAQIGDSNGNLIGGYSIRIYFLPVPSGQTKLPDGTIMPSNYWTKELLQYQQPHQPNMIDMSTIDPNSGAWRIIYVVTNYHTVDETETYTYDGRWDSMPA